jgi:hypothetical protein
MKAKEFEIKKRDPNWRTMQDIRRSGAGGQHKDKKKAEKQGYEKHKGKDVAEGSYTTEKQILTRIRQIMYDRKLSGTESNAGELNRLKQQLKDIRSQQGVSEDADELYGLRIGDTVTTKINGQTVQGDVIDLFPDDMEVELSLRGPETGKTVVVNVRDTEYFESQDLTVREEEIKKSIPELEKEMETYQAILKKSREITKSIKYDNIPSEIITEIKMLADQFNIPEEMFKDAIDEIFDARSNLESAVYSLEEPITDRIREIENAISELEDEEYYKESNEQQSSCPECGGPLVAESMLSEKKDACYYKVKSRYKVWPSAYASGALVQCRKKGAKNWGKG